MRPLHLLAIGVASLALELLSSACSSSNKQASPPSPAAPSATAPARYPATSAPLNATQSVTPLPWVTVQQRNRGGSTVACLGRIRTPSPVRTKEFESETPASVQRMLTADRRGHTRRFSAQGLAHRRSHRRSPECRSLKRGGSRQLPLRVRRGENQVATCGPRICVVAKPNACLGVEVLGEPRAFAQPSKPLADLVR